MTKREYEKITQILAKVKKVTKEELQEIILNVNPKRNPENLRFYIFDLVNNNIIYKLNDKFYKYNNTLQPFEYKYTKFEEMIINKYRSRFTEIDICIWNTSFLAKYLNFLPVINYTFIETEANFIEYLYNDMKDEYNVLIDPSEKELERYSKGNNRIIIKKLFVRAPIFKPYSHHIAANKNIRNERGGIAKPTIEKILVDIFVESNRYDVFNDIEELYIGVLKTYCVNFQKLFAYSKYRGILSEVTDFIMNRIKFDFNIGEFL